MSKKQFALRCYVKPDDNDFIAMCIDLTLAAKGKTLQEAKNNLHELMISYFQDLNKNNCKDLFPRPAPLSFKLDYYKVACLVHCHRTASNIREIFQEQLLPQLCPC